MLYSLRKFHCLILSFDWVFISTQYHCVVYYSWECPNMSRFTWTGIPVGRLVTNILGQLKLSDALMAETVLLRIAMLITYHRLSSGGLLDTPPSKGRI